MTLLQALITGPEGTPYSGGCFIFDIFFPNDYPNVPPQVNLQTTGQGKVRFNPNVSFLLLFFPSSFSSSFFFFLFFFEKIK